MHHSWWLSKKNFFDFQSKIRGCRRSDYFSAPPPYQTAPSWIPTKLGLISQIFTFQIAYFPGKNLWVFEYLWRNFYLWRSSKIFQIPKNLCLCLCLRSFFWTRRFFVFGPLLIFVATLVRGLIYLSLLLSLYCFLPREHPEVFQSVSNFLLPIWANFLGQWINWKLE